MRLFLVRHGQTAWNAAQRAQGHCDTELDDTGHEQARHLVPALETLGISRILSSDLKRSVQTAQPLATKLDIQIETTPHLRERHFGELEGLPYDEVRASISAKAILIGSPAHTIRPDGGESYVDVWKRIETAALTLEGRTETTLVVSHGGALAILFSVLMKRGIDEARAFRFANASISELVREGDVWHVVRENDAGHLEVAREGFGTGA
jgi:probable phosphoglycerate mutase